jgi:hypothetical protein
MANFLQDGTIFLPWLTFWSRGAATSTGTKTPTHSFYFILFIFFSSFDLLPFFFYHIAASCVHMSSSSSYKIKATSPPPSDSFTPPPPLKRSKTDVADRCTHAMTTDSKQPNFALTGDLDQAGPEAWYMDTSDADQRLTHKTDPVQPASLAILRRLGVLYWKVDPTELDDSMSSPKLKAIRDVRSYVNHDVVCVCCRVVSCVVLYLSDYRFYSFMPSHLLLFCAFVPSPPPLLCWHCLSVFIHT